MLETTFTTETGTVVLTDLLAMGPDNGGHRLGRDVPHLLVRRVACTAGEVEIDVSYSRGRSTAWSCRCCRQWTAGHRARRCGVAGADHALEL